MQSEKFSILTKDLFHSKFFCRPFITGCKAIGVMAECLELWICFSEFLVKFSIPENVESGQPTYDASGQVAPKSNVKGVNYIGINPWRQVCPWNTIKNRSFTFEGAGTRPRSSCHPRRPWVEAMPFLQSSRDMEWPGPIKAGWGLFGPIGIKTVILWSNMSRHHRDQAVLTSAQVANPVFSANALDRWLLDACIDNLLKYILSFNQEILLK